MRLKPPRVLRVPVLTAVLLCAAGCSREVIPPPPPLPPKPVVDLGRFQPIPIGAPIVGHPWISNLTTCDLDHDGLMDVLVCDARANEVDWIRQKAPGQFEEIPLLKDVPAPVHVEPVDMNGTGHYDLLIASMGQIFPNNDKIGTIIILANDGHEHFTKHVIAENVARVTDVQAGDFNHDGLMDLAVGQFGYDQGEIQWMENLGNWHFRSHQLLDLSGTINVRVADFNGDGTPDIVGLVSQQWEEVYLFENDGAGHFSKKIIWGSTNEDYATSNLTVCDLNRDGRPDVLFSNGDGFGPTTQPGPRPWHGVQWLENLGGGNFKFHRIGDLAGAYSPVAVDLDGDGATDVVAVSGFNNWNQPGAVSLVWFRNDGHEHFTPHILAYVPTHLLTLAAADMDNSGRMSLVTGAFFSDPPFTHLSRVLWWRPTGAPAPAKGAAAVPVKP